MKIVAQCIAFFLAISFLVIPSACNRSDNVSTVIAGLFKAPGFNSLKIPGDAKYDTIIRFQVTANTLPKGTVCTGEVKIHQGDPGYINISWDTLEGVGQSFLAQTANRMLESSYAPVPTQPKVFALLMNKWINDGLIKLGDIKNTEIHEMVRSYQQNSGLIPIYEGKNAGLFDTYDLKLFDLVPELRDDQKELVYLLTSVGICQVYAVDKTKVSEYRAGNELPPGLILSSPLQRPPTTPATPPFATQILQALPAVPIDLNGVGSTFPQILYTQWLIVFKQRFKVQINYQSLWSSAGIDAFTTKMADFGATDVMMTDAQLAATQAVAGPVLHIPTSINAISVIYNIAGIQPGQLKLTGDVLALIFLGKITRWNDPAIVTLNPTLNLPDADIIAVHESVPSIATYIFTTYLDTVNAKWHMSVGSGMVVNWQGGIGASGSDGLPSDIKQIPNSIGYVDLAWFVMAMQIPTGAQIQNSSGKFIGPSVTSATSAANGFTLPADGRLTIINSPDPGAYPICGLTWILVFQNQTNQNKAIELVYFLWWALHEGEIYSDPLHYPDLPDSMIQQVEKMLISISYNGQPILPG